MLSQSRPVANADVDTLACLATWWNWRWNRLKGLARLVRCRPPPPVSIAHQAPFGVDSGRLRDEDALLEQGRSVSVSGGLSQALDVRLRRSQIFR